MNTFAEIKNDLDHGKHRHVLTPELEQWVYTANLLLKALADIPAYQLVYNDILSTKWAVEDFLSARRKIVAEDYPND